jgi:hypothetical protein
MTQARIQALKDRSEELGVSWIDVYEYRAKLNYYLSLPRTEEGRATPDRKIATRARVVAEMREEWKGLHADLIREGQPARLIEIAERMFKITALQEEAACLLRGWSGGQYP